MEVMRSVQRTLAVLDSFSEEKPSLTLQQIANRIKLPKSTTFRLVQSLDKAGYLIRLENQEYCLSFKLVRLAGLVKSTLNIRQVARPVMEEVARLSNETVTLSMVSGRERVCIDVVDTPSPLMSVTKPGEHVRLGDGAAGKVLMAYLPKRDLPAMINSTIKDGGGKRNALLAELDKVREQGYSVTHGERVLGLTAVAAPIRDSADEVKYCVAIAGPSARIEVRVADFIKLARKAGTDISRRLGARV